MFIKTKLRKVVTVQAQHIGPGIQKYLVQILEATVAGKCSTEGFIRSGSIRLISTSMGRTDIITGKVQYMVDYEAELLFPTEGLEVLARVVHITKMGVMAGLDGTPGGETSPLDILVPRDHYVENAEYQALKEGDVFEARVLGNKFHFGDKSIFVLCEIVGLNQPPGAGTVMPIPGTTDEDAGMASLESGMKTITLGADTLAVSGGGHDAAPAGSIKSLTLLPAAGSADDTAAGPVKKRLIRKRAPALA